MPYTVPLATSNVATDTVYANLVAKATLVPEEAMGAFVGENPNGVWTLSLSDDLGGDTGILSSWELELTTLDLTPSCATNCDDGNPCTDDSCNPATGCVHVPNSASCSDGNPCTDDACVAGACVGTPNTLPCTDNNLCTLNDTCTGGACVGVAVVCDDNNVCTDDSCNPLTGLCVFAPNTGPCDDGNPCTDDVCFNGTCVGTPNTAPCDDGNVCTVGDQCVGGVCSCAASACNGTTLTFTNTTPLPIPDNTPTTASTSTITVSGAGPYLLDVNLTTFVTQTFPNDLEITLKSPAGTVSTITSRNSLSNDNVFNGTTWDDQADPLNQVPFPGDTFAASNLVTDAVYAVGVVKPTLVPEEALGAFIGEDPNGDWTLTIRDAANLDTGTLNSWSLAVTSLAAAPTTATSSFTSTDVPKTITTGAPPQVVASTVAVSGTTGALVHLRLTTNIVHTNNADLDITLTAPNGRVVTITSDNGGTFDNVFNGTVWDDKADPASQIPYLTTNPNIVTDHVYADLTPATSLVVEEALADFNGVNPNGVWTLAISDDTTANGGALNGWSLEVTTATCGACPTLDCDDLNPCTVDTCDPVLGCQHTPSDALCNDNNACTDDTCDVLLGCVYTPDDTNTCSDGDACTVDVCVGGVCQCPAVQACGGSPNTYTSIDVPKPIAATGTPVVTSVLTVAGAGSYLWDLNLKTLLTHTSSGQLQITLKSPTGTISTMTTGNGGTFDNVFNGTVWDDDADPGNEAPFPGNTFAASNLVTDTVFADNVPKPTLVPEEAMGAFIGENPNGEWTLTIADLTTGDGGNLGGWSLDLVAQATPPIQTTTSYPSTDTPKPIPDNTPTSATSSLITVSGAGSMISRIRLTNFVLHTWNSDIDLSLTSPAGTAITLTTDNASIVDNVFNGTKWDDKADPGNQVPYTVPLAASNHRHRHGLHEQRPEGDPGAGGGDGRLHRRGSERRLDAEDPGRSLGRHRHPDLVGARGHDGALHPALRGGLRRPQPVHGRLVRPGDRVRACPEHGALHRRQRLHDGRLRGRAVRLDADRLRRHQRLH